MPLPVTICLRVFGRPERTKRMIECIGNQIFPDNFEAILIGDGCEDFQKLISSKWFKDWKNEFRRKGHKLVYINNQPNSGQWGYRITNLAIGLARGKYFMFADNDDIILPEHVEHYYAAIFDTTADFAYCNTLINGEGMHIREPQLRYGSVGHAEIIVKTEFLRKMEPHKPVYGQDWIVIEEMMRKGKGIRGETPFPTYQVMTMPGFAETGID